MYVKSDKQQRPNTWKVAQPCKKIVEVHGPTHGNAVVFKRRTHNFHDKVVCGGTVAQRDGVLRAKAAVTSMQEPSGNRVKTCCAG